MQPVRAAVLGSEPRTLTFPLSGLVMPRSMSTVVDLPAPLGPRKATTSPRLIVIDKWSTAMRRSRLPVWGNDLTRSRISIAGLSMAPVSNRQDWSTILQCHNLAMTFVTAISVG